MFLPKFENIISTASVTVLFATAIQDWILREHLPLQTYNSHFCSPESNASPKPTNIMLQTEQRTKLNVTSIAPCGPLCTRDLLRSKLFFSCSSNPWKSYSSLVEVALSLGPRWRL